MMGHRGGRRADGVGGVGHDDRVPDGYRAVGSVAMIARASSGSCSRWGRIVRCTAGGPRGQPGRDHLSRQSCSHAGSVAEWSIAPVLKTGNGQPFVSSNLTASANIPAPFSVISPSVFLPGVACALHRGVLPRGLDMDHSTDWRKRYFSCQAWVATGEGGRLSPGVCR